MIVFPNCKINLGLRILRKRSDGYHAIETAFYPVSLKDALEILPATEKTTMTITGNAVPGITAENSCLKAYNLLKKDFTALPPVTIHLHKVIPAGAGLGGGSADGAFMLLLLNAKFSLGLSEKQLLHYALQLGSDSPFFILNKAVIGTGRGESLKPIRLSLANYHIALINPGIHINTAYAFSQITPAIPVKPVEAIMQQPVDTWKKELLNDFEPSVFAAHPEIGNIKETLYRHGAIYASMSGSGSTVYGIFKEAPPVLPAFPAHYFVKQF
jgi:4-diphosphocytidyl-2-C-methyl-D-erythritol kinase